MSVGCENLQLGQNTIELHLSERSTFLSNVYDAVKGTEVTEFRFFDDALIDESIYAITLNLKETCEQPVTLIDESIDLDGGLLQYRSINEDELNTRISQEEFNDNPGVIMAIGIVLYNVISDNNIGDEFVTTNEFTEALTEGDNFEDDKAWFRDHPDGGQDAAAATWLVVLLCVVICLLLSALALPIVCCIWCCRGQRATKIEKLSP